ncbi:hypothetical protein OC846_001357 [Tilletia horrida]|uniref:IMD domain-containing protein n=1 Tax=Tilletia horrida TaxID=155126 RepID=A0AAN6GVG3_9BASI|nr:hypothetical protein OC845_003550 [Tilletia horrida]KAK0556138.1 hypothetical protein OC846_001357 [Tilletia horrida]KAK0569064.1 hypothetical protein OC861_001306 [Tilletia horrida]
MPGPRSFRSATHSSRVGGGGPPSPTLSATTRASIDFPSRPAILVTRADLRASLTAFEGLLSAAKGYTNVMLTMAQASAELGSALEACARVKGAHESGASMHAASALHFLMSNYQQVMADSLWKDFSIPLLSHYDTYRAAVAERQVAHEQAVAEKSKQLKETEARNMRTGRRKERDLSSFRRALAELQAQVDSLDELKAQYYHEVIESEEEVWEFILSKVSLMVRSQLEVAERVASKGQSDPILEPMLASIPDPFDQYGPPKQDDQIFSILPPTSLLSSSAVLPSQHQAQQSHHSQQGSYGSGGTPVSAQHLQQLQQQQLGYGITPSGSSSSNYGGGDPNGAQYPIDRMSSPAYNVGGGGGGGQHQHGLQQYSHLQQSGASSSPGHQYLNRLQQQQQNGSLDPNTATVGSLLGLHSSSGPSGGSAGPSTSMTANTSTSSSSSSSQGRLFQDDGAEEEQDALMSPLSMHSGGGGGGGAGRLKKALSIINEDVHAPSTLGLGSGAAAAQGYAYDSIGSASGSQRRRTGDVPVLREGATTPTRTGSGRRKPLSSMGAVDSAAPLSSSASAAASANSSTPKAKAKELAQPEKHHDDTIASGNGGPESHDGNDDQGQGEEGAEEEEEEDEYDEDARVAGSANNSQGRGPTVLDADGTVIVKADGKKAGEVVPADGKHADDVRKENEEDDD